VLLRPAPVSAAYTRERKRAKRVDQHKSSSRRQTPNPRKAGRSGDRAMTTRYTAQHERRYLPADERNRVTGSSAPAVGRLRGPGPSSPLLPAASSSRGETASARLLQLQAQLSLVRLQSAVRDDFDDF